MFVGPVFGGFNTGAIGGGVGTLGPVFAGLVGRLGAFGLPVGVRPGRGATGSGAGSGIVGAGGELGCVVVAPVREGSPVGAGEF